MYSPLRNSSALRQLSNEDVRHLSDVAAARKLPRGEALFRQGDALPGLFCLLEGRIKLSQVGPGGQQMIMRIVGPGELFAAVAAFQPSPPCPVGAYALTDVTVAFWPGDLARSLVQDLPDLSLVLTNEISRHAQSFQHRLREVATESVPKRLAYMLIRLAESAGRAVDSGVLIDFPLTREDLASTVGTTLFTVSRVLSDWSARGIVEVGRARVVIRSLDSLRSEAEPRAEGETDS